MRKLLPIILLMATTNVARSQSCNCDITLSNLSATSLNLIWASQVSYSPGDVICIPGGTYRGLRFYDFEGTETDPVIVKNCNGQVIIDESHYSGIDFQRSEHMQLTGTGDTAHDYGFKIIDTGGGSAGVNIQNMSTDFEIDHVEIAHAGFAGIMAKTDPQCNRPETWRVNGFIMKNLDIHDNYIHNTGGEGLYIGYTKGYKLDNGRNCSGTYRYGHWLENVDVHHNILEDIGWDAIQLSLVRTAGKIHDNYIYNYGTDNKYYQDFAMGFSGGTYEVYNNISINGPQLYGNGYQMINGQSGTKIYNNVIVRPQLHGIFAHARHEFEDTSEGYYIANNTIIEPEKAGVHYNVKIIYPIDPADKYKKQDDVPSYFVNNLVVDPGYDFEGGNTWKQNQESYFDFNDRSTRDSLLTNIYSNIMTREMDTLGLTDIPNDDYSPSSVSSSVVDQGADISSWGITIDLENLARPSGLSFDIGAYEYLQSTSLQGFLPDEPELWDVAAIDSNEMKVYPNPTSSVVWIDGGAGDYTIQLFSVAGTLVYKGIQKSGEPLKVHEYAPGLYFLKVTGEKRSESYPILIK